MNAQEKNNQHLSKLPLEISELVKQLRKEILETTKPGFELAAQSTQSFNIGYSFTRKAWNSFVAIIAYKNHVNLSFPSGAYLEDGSNVLIGKGVRIRHIRINKLDDVKQDEVAQVIQNACGHALSKLSEEFTVTHAVQTFVR